MIAFQQNILNQKLHAVAIYFVASVSVATKSHITTQIAPQANYPALAYGVSFRTTKGSEALLRRAKKYHYTKP